MKHTVNSQSVCPHYKYESRPTVSCDGGNITATIRLAFADNGKAYEFKRRYCRARYRDCPIYKITEVFENEST